MTRLYTFFSFPPIINKKGLKDTATRLQYKRAGLMSSSGIRLHYRLKPSLFAFQLSACQPSSSQRFAASAGQPELPSVAPSHTATPGATPGTQQHAGLQQVSRCPPVPGDACRVQLRLAVSHALKVHDVYLFRQKMNDLLCVIK